MKVNTEIVELKAEIVQLQQQNQWLLEQLKLAKARRFGASSEQISTEQMSLFNEAELHADEPAPKQIKAHTRRQAGQIGLDKLPKDLPIELVEHDLPDDEKSCPDCGNDLHVMGKKTRDELKFVPAKAVIVRHVAKAYACRDCEKHGTAVPMFNAKLPEPVIKGSFASPETIAHITCEKFVMASPLYRQEQDWARKGIALSRQTMSNWIMRATNDWLVPIYDAMKAQLLTRDIVQGDETTLQVLHEPGKTPQSKSQMWLFRSSGDAERHIVLYDYQPDRSHRRPGEFLRDWCGGYLLTDGYEGYRKVKNANVVGCWAHVRRKFHDALKITPEKTRAESLAQQALLRIGQIYKLEEQFRAMTAQARHAARLEQTKPLMEELFAWCATLDVLPKSALGKAVNYCRNQRHYLENFLLDGRLEIDNNRAERSIKVFVIGRKNWLFCNTPRGAQASAVLYSLIESAKENGRNPYEYLVHVLKTAPNVDLNVPENLNRLLP